MKPRNLSEVKELEDLSNSQRAAARVEEYEKEGLEEFEGPSVPGEFTLFVMPERQPYRDQLDEIVCELKEGVESGKIQEVAMVYKINNGYKTVYSGSQARSTIAAAMIGAGMERLGFVKE